MTVTYAYAADIVKTERNADGDLEVFGKAAGPELDIAYQVCDPKWLKTAMPEWMEWGNIREQHSMLAAGVGTELTENGTDWHLKSTCIDPGTARKLEAGLLKGYSVGIKNPKIVRDNDAPGGRIVGGTICEISYVDRPANPTCTLTLAKAAQGSGDLLAVEAPESEQVIAAKGVLADLAVLVPDLAKADDEASDIAGAQDAISTIARLIQSEASGLAAGQMNEAQDIRLLLDAVSALRWFMEREATEPDPPEDDMDDTIISLGVSADLVKAVQADDASDDDRDALRADVLKALGLDTLADTISDQVAAKVTDKISADIDSAKAATADTIKGVTDRLAQVEQMAAPGGPIRARTPEQTNKAATADNARTKAAHYRQMAGQVDRVTAEGYLALAEQLEATL